MSCSLSAALLSSLSFVAILVEKGCSHRCPRFLVISQLQSGLFCLSPKDSTGEPLYNLSNQTQINQEVKREVTPGFRGSEGARCITASREHTRRWPRAPPTLGKVLPALLEFKKGGLACQSMFTRKRIFPNPQKFRQSYSNQLCS